MFTLLYVLLAIVTGVNSNIYFPELYEDALYKPANLGPTPMEFQTIAASNTTLVEWALIGEEILGSAKFSEDSGPSSCFLAKINFTNIITTECKFIQHAKLIKDYIYLLTLHCKLKNHAMLIKLSKFCIKDETPSRNWEVVYTAFDNKREINIDMIGNKTASVLVWLQKSQFYSIMTLQNWPDSKIQLENNLVIGELQSELKIVDVAATFETLYVFSDTCLYSCPLTACRELQVISDSCVLTPNNETVSGIMKTVTDGERIILLDKFITLSVESHSFRCYFSIYCAGRLTHHMYKCGSFVIQDIVLTFNMVTRSLAVHFPCSISTEGSLIACLILGEPRIFDVSDKKSAYPISAFTVSAWRLGVAINRFGFASSDIFFFEIVPSLTADPRGFIFNVRAELQPALIASRLLYPSLATSITPAESFLLVNHHTRDIWLFSHGGRLFFRDGSKENSLSIDFEYAEAYSFFIADTFSSAGINHNFEHPFAFFSPDGGTFAYLSYYRSPYGAFSASAITVTNATVADLRSIVSISDKVFIIQAGINPRNDHLFVVQELSNDYLTIQIFKIADMAQMSYNMSGIVAQAEVKGAWSWDEFDATESTRVWVIYFTNDDRFLLASHNNTELATSISDYKVKADYTVELQRNGVIPNCLAVTNYNDYLRTQIIILCAETLLSNVVNQTYHVTFISAVTLKSICTQTIDHKFGSLLSKYDDLFVTNIPILDFNEVAQRLVISFEKTVLMYATDTCPFRLLYRFDHTDLIAGIGMIHTGQDHKPFGITFVTYLQKVDLIGDCINGYGVDTVLPRNYFCSRCTPGHVGLGCRLCPSGFFCSDYSQLQPSGACPEGFYCLDGTSTSNPLADVLDKTATPPHLCPAGAYCPAGTAQGFANDETANAPQSCLSGFFCPAGSVKPTQERCPENATSNVGAKVLEDCFCKINFYGSPEKRCMPCLHSGNCPGGNRNSTDAAMFVPQGYWPDIPSNVKMLSKCYMTMSRFTPCKGSVCRLECQNRTQIDEEISCKGICSYPCEKGHIGRLCSACENGYYRKSPYHCAPCHMGLRQTLCVVAALLTSIIILAMYFVRKHFALKEIKDEKHLVSDQQLLEFLITLLLLLLGISSTASVLFMVFIVVIVYMQQLRSPQYATLTFIFYIQTLQALLQGNFMWPEFMKYILQFLEIMYAPVPGLACLPNFYTGKNLGWEGAFLLIFSLPLVLGFLIGLYMFVTGTVQKRPVWKRAFLSYCLFISVLQFPLSNMSLGTLSCKQDLVTNKWYMSSQPWKECRIDSIIQIFGLSGSIFYFLGIPFTLHYWYYRQVFPDDITNEIGDMFLPAGVQGNEIFIIFLTLRWMLTSVILSFLPFSWGLQRPAILALLLGNIILVLYLDPYEKYYPRTPLEMSQTQKKWFDRLCITMSGNFLDVVTLTSIILSYAALDYRDNWTILQIKSFVIGVGNLFICVYFIICILLEDRLTLFPKVSKLMASIEDTLNKYCVCRVKAKLKDSDFFKSVVTPKTDEEVRNESKIDLLGETMDGDNAEKYK